jgi:Xaa-Pro aminopeptidase
VTDLSQTTPLKELERRLAGLQAHLRDRRLDAALLMQNTDLFYFAGTIQQAHLYVPVEGPPLLMVRKSLARARAESPLPHVLPPASPREIAGLLARHDLPAPASLGMELDVVPAATYLRYAEIFPGRLEDIAHEIRLLRSVKSAHEVALMRQAAAFADQVAAAARELIREGQTEIELAGQVEAVARRLGHQGVVRMRLWGGELFYGHLLAGPPAAVPSYLASPTGGPGVSPAVAQGPGFGRLRRGEPVLLDYVFAWQGYIADHSRIFALGRLPDDLLRAHEAMLTLQEEIARAALPGVPAGDLYALAVARAAELGYGDWFMGADEERIRFIGHGVGLELDEYPFLAQGQKMPLAEGMTIALEPKLIIPGQGVVGIENTHLVTPRGLERLTRFPDAVQVVPTA